MGRKVSIRYRLHDDPSHPFSEAVGVVASLDESADPVAITVLTRRGEKRVVPLEDILAAKEFPA